MALFMGSIQTNWITGIATSNPYNFWVKLGNFSYYEKCNPACSSAWNILQLFNFPSA